MYQLFGVFVMHSPESCPLNNKHNRQILVQVEDRLKVNLKKFKIRKIVGFYMSVLEHEWIIILEAGSAHDIESLCIDVGISAFNTIKIVPLNNFDVVMKRIKAGSG